MYGMNWCYYFIDLQQKAIFSKNWGGPEKDRFLGVFLVFLFFLDFFQSLFVFNGTSLLLFFTLSSLPSLPLQLSLFLFLLSFLLSFLLFPGSRDLFWEGKSPSLPNYRYKSASDWFNNQNKAKISKNFIIFNHLIQDKEIQ